MFKSHPIQTNFTSGELSPRLLGRSDIEQYFNGAEIIENFFVKPHGPITKRTGTKYHALAATQTLSKTVRLVEFVFSRTESRLLEFSENKIRVLDENGALILSGGNPVVIATSYHDDDVDTLQFAQSADVLFISHPNYPPAKLSRLSDTNWTLTEPTFYYGPYQDQEEGDQAISLSIQSVSDQVTLTSSSADFTTTVANDYVEYPYRGQKVLGKVISKTSDYVVVVEPLEDRSLILSKEVYSPGTYTGWDTTNNIPQYGTISAPASNATIAFSATGVITQEHIGNYLRFCNAAGTYFWMYVKGADNLVRMGAYGILATGDVLTVRSPAGTITRSARNTFGYLVSSSNTFFTPEKDIGRNFRLILGDNVVHVTGYIPPTQYPRTVNMTAGSAVLTGDPSGFSIGHTVAGIGIPAGATITAINPGVSFTISVNATRTRTAATVYVGTYIYSGSKIPVQLSRSLPRSQEGLSIVQAATTNDWNRGAWYYANYPATVTFHEERLGFGGTYDEPQTCWLSKTADYYNFASTDEQLRVLDDSAITFTLSSDTVNHILWMASRSMLVVGTVGGEWKVTSGQTGDALTPTNVSVQNQSAYSSAFAKPLIVGRSIIYLQRSGRRLWEMTYDFQSDDLVSLDLNIFSDHILKNHSGGQQLSYQLLPDSVIYVRLGDGQVAVLTYEPSQKVYAWSRIILGGTQATVESICSLPRDNAYRLFFVVRRYINGAWVRTIESLEPEFLPSSPTDHTNMHFMDGCVTGTSASATFTGLTHLAGETVSALIDDSIHHGLTVNASGAITLPAAPTTRYCIGMPYTATIKLFPLEAQAQFGTGQGKTKRIVSVVVRLLDSIGLSFGTDVNNLREVVFTNTDNPLNQIPQMFSGDKRLSVDNGYDTRAALYFRQTKSYPLTILSVMPEVSTNS